MSREAVETVFNTLMEDENLLADLTMVTQKAAAKAGVKRFSEDDTYALIRQMGTQQGKTRLFYYVGEPS